MERHMSKPKVIAGIVTVLFAASLVGILIISNNNKSLKTGIGIEKLNSEKLLAEKLSLSKDVAQFNKEIDQLNLDMNSLKGNNSELNNLLAQSQKTLLKKQDELNRLARSNAGKKAIESKLEELRKIIDSYESQIATLNDRINALVSENAEIIEENDALTQIIDVLKLRNKAIADDNQKLKSMEADAYLVESYKGKKDKLTLLAKKANKIVLNFEVHEDIELSLRFNIIGPDNKQIDGSEKNITTTILGPGLIADASSAQESQVKPTKRIKMEYNPKEKFNSGIYTIEIFNGDNYLGSCQVRLK